MKKQITITGAALVAMLLAACGSEDGENGQNGQDGENGQNGQDGENGQNGENGENGMDGSDGSDGADGSDGSDGSDGMDASEGTGAPGPRLTRLATTPLGAELTGMEKSLGGDFFFNVQHPSSSLPGDENLAAVGVWTGVDLNNLDPHLPSLRAPDPASANAETTQVVVGAYQVLGRETDTFSGLSLNLPSGLGNIVGVDGTTPIKQSNDPDFNAFIPTNDDGTEGYLFTAWEDRPGGMSRLGLTKKSDGTWDVTAAENVDFSSVKGTIINCFGSVSPWGTPLTSEENYEAENTTQWNNENYSGGYPNYSDVLKIRDYLGLAAPALPNPYDYGYIVEVTEPTEATPGVVKHYTMGRVAHENPIIMPDQKTVYLTDDGGFKGFYKFVATTAGDMSEGTLYAAKIVQDGVAGSTKPGDSATTGFDITWIELGTSSNADIHTFIRTFDGVEASDYVDGSTNFVEQATIDAYTPGTNDELAFVETLRVAEALGATVEFNKMEGININYAGAESGDVPFMYVAMAVVSGAMSDGTGDINVTANPCGIVYRFELADDFNVSRMEPVVVGGAYDGTSTGDRCDTDAIAQPDNIYVLDDGRVLIGEDTSNHKNNMLWVYNPAGQ